MSRYLQQITVSEIGKKGQNKLKNTKVLIIGAGGLGTPVATLLGTMGVGVIGIADGDSINKSNLHRQFLYYETEIGLLKTDVIISKLSKQNPETEFVNFPYFITEKNIQKTFTNFDIICDCTDNGQSRILINNFCQENHLPLVYAAVKDWEGYVSILHHKNKINLEDIFSEKSLLESNTSSCEVAGIINTTCTIAGSIQANEVLKIILDLDEQLDGQIMCFNTLNMIFKKYNILGSKTN
ncbi:HesA/MoeB/ThiF family protein [Flavobacterium sp. C3NV]|uniref:HesA/MoeB/ThiF family protein n=1 Tax=Flavobacterium sp. C3NV TaxID=3393358 RepID=UPI0039902433